MSRLAGAGPLPGRGLCRGGASGRGLWAGRARLGGSPRPGLPHLSARRRRRSRRGSGPEAAGGGARAGPEDDAPARAARPDRPSSVSQALQIRLLVSSPKILPFSPQCEVYLLKSSRYTETRSQKTVNQMHFCKKKYVHTVKIQRQYFKC